VVTGASTGMGAAIARALGARGLAVAIGARRADRLEPVAAEIRADGGTAFACALDVGDAASVADFFDAAEAELGPVAVAVSNAGSCVPALVDETDPADLAAQVATNLLGPMYVARRALPSMREQRRGDLVFVSSEAARVPRPYQAAYSAAKAGVEALAQALTLELEGSGVRVTTVRMGPTQTEFGRDWPPDVIQRVLTAWQHFGLQRHLRFLKPEVVADAVLHAVTAPPGAILATVELQPEGPAPVPGVRGA